MTMQSISAPQTPPHLLKGEKKHTPWNLFWTGKMSESCVHACIVSEAVCVCCLSKRVCAVPQAVRETHTHTVTPTPVHTNTPVFTHTYKNIHSHAHTLFLSVSVTHTRTHPVLDQWQLGLNLAQYSQQWRDLAVSGVCWAGREVQLCSREERTAVECSGLSPNWVPPSDPVLTRPPNSPLLLSPLWKDERTVVVMERKWWMD